MSCSSVSRARPVPTRAIAAIGAIAVVATIATSFAAGEACAQGRAFILGAGFEGDSADGIAVTAIGDMELGERTWLSGAVGRTTVDLPRDFTSETWYGDVGIDHYFDPIGLRLSAAYWGDADILDSIDARGSIYSRGEAGSLGVDIEHRDFEFDVPAIGDQRPETQVGFSAVGLGMTGRLNLPGNVNLHASGMSYEYDVNLRVEDSDRLANLLSISRLSLLSSLIDWRVSAGVGVDVGLRRFQFDVARWRGSIDGSDNFGATFRFLMPMSERTDVELSLGFDDSDLYDSVTVFSVFVYFYGT